MRNTITITTDFGDVYPSIMKGVMLGIDPDINIVDVTNSVPPGNIRYGAFVLKFASAYFPPGTVHLAVIDPGVGSDRKAIVVKGQQYTFVGPDNGLILPAAKAQGPFKAYEITDINFFKEKISPVFHGRDIFAPAAAYAASGRDIPSLKEIDKPVDLDLGNPVVTGDTITGSVLFVDRFGNVVTNINRESLQGPCQYGDMLTVNGLASILVKTYSDAEKSSLVVLAGSHGMVEIACNEESASAMTRLKEGDEVRISMRKGKRY